MPSRSGKAVVVDRREILEMKLESGIHVGRERQPFGRREGAFDARSLARFAILGNEYRKLPPEMRRCNEVPHAILRSGLLLKSLLKATVRLVGRNNQIHV